MIHDLKHLWCRNRQRRLEHLRRRYIGFALQSGELLNSLKVWENIAVPLRLNGVRRRKCRARVSYLLTCFGLNDNGHVAMHDSEDELLEGKPVSSAAENRLANARVNKLSGGEYQRVVLARAIAHQPRLVFVDEPTASLNRELARTSLQQLKQSLLAGTDPGAVVMVTHDEVLASEFADVIIRMAPEKGRAAGRVVEVFTQTPEAPEPA